MTDCARCGDCCDPVIVAFDPQEMAADLLSRSEVESHNRINGEFMRDHWTVESTYEAADSVTVRRVRCDVFDPVRRLCGAHESRPPVCWGFPWYHRPPGDPDREPAAASLSPRCSFNADVPGRRMLPIVEVR